MSFAPKHILVPVDVDPVADRALADRLVDDACAIAKKYGARITLLHVAVPVVSPMAAPFDLMGQAYRSMLDVAEARNAACGRVLKELEKRALALDVPVKSLITSRAGSVPEVIVETAKTEDAELIVLTTHARTGLSRLLLGSVAERTAHLSPVPVLLLPPVGGM